MTGKHYILAINGSASEGSSCLRILQFLREQVKAGAEVEILENLRSLPHFSPELSVANTPPVILELRNRIRQASGILICTPEYVFSIPSGLKNLVEWCVSTTVFAQKPVGLITASAHGQKGHEELQLIMRTVEAQLSDATTLLVPGVKGKISREGLVTDAATAAQLRAFSLSFLRLISA
jgi:NAD(P)H-dependent FMN reductase